MSEEEYGHGVGIGPDAIHEQGHYSGTHRNHASVVVDADMLDCASDVGELLTDSRYLGSRHINLLATDLSL